MWSLQIQFPQPEAQPSLRHAAGISGAVGRESAICVAATNGRAGAGGVTGAKIEGTDAAISGTVGAALAAGGGACFCGVNYLLGVQLTHDPIF